MMTAVGCVTIEHSLTRALNALTLLIGHHKWPPVYKIHSKRFKGQLAANVNPKNGT